MLQHYDWHGACVRQGRWGVVRGVGLPWSLPPVGSNELGPNRMAVSLFPLIADPSRPPTNGVGFPPSPGTVAAQHQARLRDLEADPEQAIPWGGLHATLVTIVTILRQPVILTPPKGSGAAAWHREPYTGGRPPDVAAHRRRLPAGHRRRRVRGPV